MSETIGITPFKSPTLEALPRQSGISPADREDENYKLHRRFDRLGRLYGDGAVHRLMGAKVVVFGLGGVGSFAAEALARSAIGHLMLVDFDDVCVTNANRQLQALQGNTGKPKADVLAERMRLVNPKANVEFARAFYKEENADEMLTPPWGGEYDFVVDAIDNITAKCHLIATCVERGIPLVSSMGAAGKLDPTQVRIADLGKTEGCRLARDVRKILRKKYGFPAKGDFGVPTVYSTEARQWPRELSYDGGKGFRCVCPHKSNEHGCDSRALIDGTASFVTGTFGLTCGSVVINTMTRDLMDEAKPSPSQTGYRPGETE